MTPAPCAVMADRNRWMSLRLFDIDGDEPAKNFGLMLQHLFNYQTQHDRQANTLLFQAGEDVGVIDLDALIANEVAPAGL